MAEGIHVVLVVNDEAAHWQGYRDRLAANDGAASVSVAVPAGRAPRLHPGCRSATRSARSLKTPPDSWPPKARSSRS